MPFEDDGLRGVARCHASRGRAMPFEDDGYFDSHQQLCNRVIQKLRKAFVVAG